MKGTLEPGQQIWVYHDGQTDSWNPVARINKYSHVLVYVGTCQETEQDNIEVHEVVHVSLAPIRRGLSKAKIRKQAVLKVIKSENGANQIKYDAIKPDQQVFGGHKIEECQFSANVMEKIKERAIKCSEKPSILFDYNYR